MNKSLLITVCCFSIIAFSCSKRENKITPVEPPGIDTSIAAVTVDCGKTEGGVMNIAAYNNMSGTSKLPGDATKAWLQSQHIKTLRVWIALNDVYHNGNTNYNPEYGVSYLHLQDALDFYSQCADSLLVVFNGFNSTAHPLPTGDSLDMFLTHAIMYYKQKYPKIRYIEADNEPDHAGLSMDDYYAEYQHYYTAVYNANDSLHLQNDPLLISNGPFGNPPGMLDYADQFFTHYQADTNPKKAINFFSFHSYGQSNRPVQVEPFKQEIDSMFKSRNLPMLPVFITEYGAIGGSHIPSALGLSGTITMQPAEQLTKAFYFYEGGIDRVFNWCIHHGSIEYKSEVSDIDKGILSPYGNALQFCREISDRGTRINAVSKDIDSVGMGVHVLASMGNGKGIAVMVWNYNWDFDVPGKDINVLIKNIPSSIFNGGKIHTQLYMIDAEHNNYPFDHSQNTLTASEQGILDFKSTVSLPLSLEKNSVALILLTPN